MRSLGAQRGHVKRRLRANERLTGKVLEFALAVLSYDPSVDSKRNDFLAVIARKLMSGEKLTEYEHHYMVDVLLIPGKHIGA